MFPTNHLWLSDASCLHAAMPSHASSQVVRRLSQSAALTMTSALQAVEEREHRNSDTIEPQGQFRVKRICKRDFKKTSLKSMWRRLGGRKTCCTCQAYVNMIQYVEGSVLPYYNDNWYDKINSFHIRLQYLYKIVIAIWLYMFESVIIYDIIYIYIYQTRLAAFKLLRPMSSAPARGSELLESVEDLKEEEVEDGNTHSHTGIELHLHVSFLGVAAWVSCDMLWKGNCFQASHRPFELLWFVDHVRLQEIVELDGAALTDRVKQLTGLWRENQGWKMLERLFFDDFPWFPAPSTLNVAGWWGVVTLAVYSYLRRGLLDAETQPKVNRKMRRCFDHVWPMFLILVWLLLDHEQQLNSIELIVQDRKSWNWLVIYRQTKMDGTLPETSDQCTQLFSFRVSTSMHQDWQMLNLASPDLIVSGQVDGSIYVGVKDSGAWRHPPWFPEGTMFIWDAEFIHQIAGLAVSILVTMEYVMNWESLSGLFHSLFSPSLSFALLSFALCIISIYSTFRFERPCILFISLHHFL